MSRRTETVQQEQKRLELLDAILKAVRELSEMGLILWEAKDDPETSVLISMTENGKVWAGSNNGHLGDLSDLGVVDSDAADELFEHVQEAIVPQCEIVKEGSYAYDNGVFALTQNSEPLLDGSHYE